MSKGLFESIRISGTGLAGQRVKMDVVARNLANAETTQTAEGTPYRRQRAVFREVLEVELVVQAGPPGLQEDREVRVVHD